MDLEDAAGKIRFRHTPVSDWLMGLCLTFVVALLIFGVLASLVPITRYTNEGLVYGFLAVAIFIGIVRFVLWRMLLAPRVSVEIDLHQKYLELIRHYLYCTDRDRFQFFQVLKMRSYKRKLNFREQYFLALVSMNRKTVELGVPIGTEKHEVTKLIKKLNALIKERKTPEPADATSRLI